MVEVMVAILILMIAIIPMFTMFDVGLRTATTSGNYDKARSLAEKQVELAQSIPYSEVRDNFPQFRSADSGCLFTGPPNTIATQCIDPAYPNLEYRMEKQYLKLPPDLADNPELEGSSTPTSMIQLTICVYRDGESCDTAKIFDTTGVVVE